MGKVLKRGEFYSDTITIVVSDKSSLSKGLHVVADILGPDGTNLDHDVLTKEEKAEVFIFLTRYLQERHPDGRWTIMLNGPGMTTRPNFHIHGTLPEAQGQTLRFVFNPSAFLVRLKEQVARLEIYCNTHHLSIDGLKALIKELEDNLK